MLPRNLHHNFHCNRYNTDTVDLIILTCVPKQVPLTHMQGQYVLSTTSWYTTLLKNYRCHCFGIVYHGIDN